MASYTIHQHSIVYTCTRTNQPPLTKTNEGCFPSSQPTLHSSSPLRHDSAKTRREEKNKRKINLLYRNRNVTVVRPGKSAHHAVNFPISRVKHGFYKISSTCSMFLSVFRIATRRGERGGEFVNNETTLSGIYHAFRLKLLINILVSYLARQLCRQ